eukprot:TRINITY_DN36996_c1_g1_i2.p1 TRINITY_DN36996_c1_g1~~TRINITY_DN36996_c1_g1_i2.p1  ORF type:complete len:281 (+),score=27.32 TRINITY_DN36996_c1_g1_i2:150-992(+)
MIYYETDVPPGATAGTVGFGGSGVGSAAPMAGTFQQPPFATGYSQGGASPHAAQATCSSFVTPKPAGISVRPFSAEAAYQERLVFAHMSAHSKAPSLGGPAPAPAPPMASKPATPAATAPQARPPPPPPPPAPGHARPPAAPWRAGSTTQASPLPPFSASTLPSQGAGKASCNARCPTPLHIGANVVLCGLKTAALNGQQGILQAFDPAAGRWHVHVNGEVKSLKPDNLVVLQGQEPVVPIVAPVPGMTVPASTTSATVFVAGDKDRSRSRSREASRGGS